MQIGLRRLAAAVLARTVEMSGLRDLLPIAAFIDE